MNELVSLQACHDTMGSWGSLHAVAARPHASSSNLHTNHGPYRTGRSFPSCPRLGRYHTETKVPPSSSIGTVAASNEAVAALRQQQRRDSNGVEAAAASRQQQPRQHWPSRGVRKYSSKCTRIEFRDRQINCPRRPPPPGRVSGQTETHSNCPRRPPPVEFRDRQTEYHYMGEELGNYVHQNFQCQGPEIFTPLVTVTAPAKRLK